MSDTTLMFQGATPQTVSIEVTGTYDITAFGAQGGQGEGSGGLGGLGAEAGGDFVLAAGDTVIVIVGGEGKAGEAGGGGGGGGTFIEVLTPERDATRLLIAGGGGGGSANNLGGPNLNGGSGLAGTSGGHGSGNSGGIQGVNGSGGHYGGFYGGGGGGYSGGQGGGFGATGTNGGGIGSGYAGGPGYGSGGGGGYGGGGGGGAFGGGGGGGWGGGGGGGTYGGGGGGGSFDSGTSQVLVAGENSGDGLVTIELVCYLRGTNILTPTGEKPVQTLQPGDLVTTLSGQHRPLRWIGFGRTLVTPANRDRATPVVVRRGALADGVPHRDLYITRGHSLYLDGVLIPVEELINHRTIAWVESAQVVEYYHLELDDHDVIIAEGAAAESYREDNNSPLFHNAGTRTAKPPVPPYAPVLHTHPTVKRIWRELNERSEQPDPTLVDDPDLHLMADGKRLDADTTDRRVWRFRLGAPTTDLRVMSRSSIPSMLGTDQDQRRLGVALRRIVLARPGLRMEIGWDNECLITGFHGPEADNCHRWTNGEAVLPANLLALFGEGADVELHVNGLLPYAVDMGVTNTLLLRA
jgi:hypothetical protein